MNGRLGSIAALVLLTGLSCLPDATLHAEHGESVVCPPMEMPPRQVKSEFELVEWINRADERCLPLLDGRVKASGALMYVRLVDGTQGVILRPRTIFPLLMFRLDRYDHKHNLLFFEVAGMHLNRRLVVDLTNALTVSMPGLPDYSSDGRWALSVGRLQPVYHDDFSIFDMAQHPPAQVFLPTRETVVDGAELRITRLNWVAANRIEGSAVWRRTHTPDRPAKVSIEYDGVLWNLKVGEPEQ